MNSVPRLSRLLVATAAAAISLAGCSGAQSDPTEYGSINDQNEGYYGNMMFGCTGVEANEDGEYVDETLEKPNFCRCVFRGMKETVPFGEARAFDEDQAAAQDGADISIPRKIDAVRAACATDVEAYS